MRVRFPSPAPDVPRGPALRTPEKLILGAAAALFAVGGVLAVAQPGDLGDDAAETAGETTTTVDDTTTTVEDTTTSTADAGPPTTEGDDPTVTTGGGSPTPTVGPSGQPTETTTPGGSPTTVPDDGASTTTVGGSGIGGGGTPTGGARGIADTGHESLLGAGLALTALGLGLRRLRPTT